MTRGRGRARDIRRPWLTLVCALLTVAMSARASAAVRPAGIIIVPSCDGDCDGDGQVSIAELVTGVNIAQGQLGVTVCPAFDGDGDGGVSIAELVAAVSGALTGCGVVSEPLTLSDTSLAPGEMLTLFHSSIAAGDAVEVVFQGPGRYRLTVRTQLTEDGAARVAVPPYIDPDSGEFGSSEVAVSIAGIDGAVPFFIDPLPEVAGRPGELTAALLDAGADSVTGALLGLAALRSETGVEQPQLAIALLDQAEIAGNLADELDASGTLTLGTANGPVVMDAATLALLDRLIAAPFLGYARQHPLAGAVGRAADLPDREELADLIERVKRQGVSGMQVLGSYVSVLSGVVGLVASVVPGGQPLAGVAAATAVAATGVVTLGSAAVSIAADLGIDAIRGNDPDLYRAARNAQDVVVSGLRSIALTAAGAIEWVGDKLVGLASLANDTRDGVVNVRDLACATERRGSLQREQQGARGDFCRLTQDSQSTPTPTLRPPPTATPTMRPPATATPTHARTATPTRAGSATPVRTATSTPRMPTPRATATVTRPPATATRTGTLTPTPTVAPRTATATPTRTRTPTRTATQGGGFTVLFYQNTDGSTGNDASGAQLKLSGASDFPTIGWTSAVGSVGQVTVGRNDGAILYGIAAAGDGEGEPIPIRGPVRYGNYDVPDTVRIVDSSAPALQPGIAYVAVVTPFPFQGYTAALVFRVDR